MSGALTTRLPYVLRRVQGFAFLRFKFSVVNDKIQDYKILKNS